MIFERIFLLYSLIYRRDGKLHARETGCFTFRLCLSEPRMTAAARIYFSDNIAVTDKNTTIISLDERFEYGIVRKYILRRTSFDRKVERRDLSGSFNGILVNPTAIRLRRIIKAPVSRNRGIIDGIKVNGDKSADEFRPL
ncbi:MAG: hypothetical protein ACLRSW_11570 [Christensenellaceae bacterium]